MVGASVSGCMAHWARRNVDLKMGMILLLGGFGGSTLGVWVFRLLRTLGQIELTIQLCYVVLLGVLGTLMLVDALKMFYRRGKGGAAAARGAHRHTWIHHLPYNLIGMPSTVVVGTSLFQIIFVAANVTVLQAVTNHTVDALLALLLLIGGVVGAQIGARVGARLRTEQLRILLALMVLAMSIEVFLELAVPPDDVYAITSGTS